MVNLFTYQNLIERFFLNHFQINTVLVGDKKDITAKTDIVYPLANIEYLDKTIKGGDDVYRFEIIIADLSSKENELYVINDANQIGDDLVNYFEQNDFEDLEIFNSVSLKPFTDSFGDRISGVTFVVSFTGFRLSCDSTIPFKVEPTPPEGGANRRFTYTFPYNLD